MKVLHGFWRATLGAALTLAAATAAFGADMKIGALPAADSVVLHVAADEGLFAAEVLDVEVVPFQSALELGAAMRAGNLAGHFGDIINVLIQREGGVDQAIVATTTHSSPGQRNFGLVVSPRSKAQSLADLKGADIAVAGATIIDYLLDKMLEQQGLPADHFRRQDIRQIPVRLQMLLSGRLEAALLPEPLVSLVEAQGARTLWDDRGLNTPLAVIALRRDNADADTVRRFRRALGEAARRIDAEPERYKAIMIDKGLLPKAAADAYRMLRFGGQARNEADEYPDALPPLPTRADVEDFAVWMRKGGMLKKMPETPADVVLP